MKLILPFMLVISIAIIGCTNTDKNDGNINYEGHPIIGVWNIDFDGCTETQEFLPNGIKNSVSNLEIVKAAYTISRNPSNRGFYKIKAKCIKDNGKADCTGSTEDSTGKVVELYIIFGPKNDYFALCKEESLKRCLSPFQKSEMAEPHRRRSGKTMPF